MNTNLNTLQFFIGLIGMIYFIIVGIHESAWLCFALMIASWFMHTGNMFMKMIYVILQWKSDGVIAPTK